MDRVEGKDQALSQSVVGTSPELEGSLVFYGCFASGDCGSESKLAILRQIQCCLCTLPVQLWSVPAILRLRDVVVA